jgi:hypothetical protein
MFPSWERFAIGRTFEALIVFFGAFYFLIKLMDSLSYLDNFTQKLSLLFQSKEIKNYLFSKFTAFSILFANDSTANNEKKRLIDIHYMKGHYRILRANDPSFKGVDHNIIYESLHELCNPVLFLCLYYLFRIILFAGKYTLFYLTMIISLIYEYFCIKYSLCKTNKIFCYTFPITVFLFSYLTVSLVKLYYYLKEKRDYYEMKIFTALFEVLHILGLFLLFFTCLYCISSNADSKYIS